MLELRRELDARPEEIHAYLTDRASIEEISGYTVNQGLKATARRAEVHTLYSVKHATASPRLFVACDGLANAENMGAIIRNSAAFGADALLVGETSTSPFLTRTIRASMGTIFDLPSIDTEILADALLDLKLEGMRIVGAHAHASQKTIGSVDFSTDTCLVLGSEGHGLTRRIMEMCDDLVIIPMAGDVDSLNVGSAAAVFLYEVARQRGKV
jgi:tRNA G18 (ribose-2'-O)-methylase SpoU